MAAQLPERCLDCGADLPGGGFCRRCLKERVGHLEQAWDRVEDAEELKRPTRSQRLRLRLLYPLLRLGWS